MMACTNVCEKESLQVKGLCLVLSEWEEIAGWEGQIPSPPSASLQL